MLSTGAIEVATRAMAAFISEPSLDERVYLLLYQRIRRGDPIAWWVAVAAFGPRLVELISDGEQAMRPQEVDLVLRSLKPAELSPLSDDPAERDRRALIDYVRGLALMHAGRYQAARAVFSALSARFSASLQAEGTGLSKIVILRQEVQLAVHLGDEVAAVAGVREILGLTGTPYIELDKMLSDTDLSGLINVDTWRVLRSEIENVRP